MTPEALQIPQALAIPAEQKQEQRWKCHTCKLVLFGDPPKEGVVLKCPECGNPTEKMCPRDHIHCFHDITPGIAYCPDCGEPVCPECGSHDVVQISRVTGYLQEVNGWNAGKQQELKDRKRYSIA